MDNVTIHRKRISVNVGEVTLQHSCYDLCVLETELQQLGVENADDIINYIYDNCEYISLSPTIEDDDLPIISNEQLSMF